MSILFSPYFGYPLVLVLFSILLILKRYNVSVLYNVFVSLSLIVYSFINYLVQRNGYENAFNLKMVNWQTIEVLLLLILFILLFQTIADKILESLD